MKPIKTNQVITWRFREIGIEISFWRDTRMWGGSITVGGRTRTLSTDMLATIITMHGLEAQVQ